MAARLFPGRASAVAVNEAATRRDNEMSKTPQDKPVMQAKQAASRTFGKAVAAGYSLRDADRMAGHRLALALDDIELGKDGKR